MPDGFIVTFIKAFVLANLVMLVFAFLTWLERRLLGRFGPERRRSGRLALDGPPQLTSAFMTWIRPSPYAGVAAMLPNDLPTCFVEGYAAIGAESASAARTMAAAHAIDLALVDIHMPGEDGLSLARHLRERYAKIAIVMLTSADTVVDRIVGLEMGADDYVPKPFDPRELVARVKSVLRRTSSANRGDIGAAKVRIGRCVLDVAAHRLTDEKGGEVAMSPLEFDLLVALARKPRQVFTREVLLEQVWGYCYGADTRLVNVHVQRLRSKVERDPEHPEVVLTVRGVGYKAGPP